MRVIRIFRPFAILVLLLFTLTSAAQNNINGIIEFNKQVHDFGDITLSSGKHKYSFTFRNVSKIPIVIQTVISSCGCTTPVWTRNPVKPGESGNIEVTFLNDQGPYPFDKALTVYVSGVNRPIILRIKGVVHEKAKSLSQLFPYKIGELSFRGSFADIGQIAQGDTKRESITVANTGGRPLRIGVTNLPGGLRMSANPAILGPGKKGEINIELDTKADKRWGSVNLSGELVLDGKSISSPKFEVRARILDNFSSLTDEETDQAPLPMTDNNVYAYGIVKPGTKIQHTFEIRNLGRKPLTLYKYESNFEGVSVTHPTTIAPGASGKAVVVAITGSETGDKLYQITFITNSPGRPAFSLLLSGAVIR